MPNLTPTALTPRSALGGEVGGRPRNLIAEPPLGREQLLPGQQAPAATPLLRHPPPPRHLAGQLLQPHPLQRLHAQRWVIAILKKNQFPTTLPITSILSSWHYQLK
jgi:hypothetical protein